MNKQQEVTSNNNFYDELTHLEENDTTEYNQITTTHQSQTMARQNVVSNGTHQVRALKDISWVVGTRIDNSQNELVSLKIEHTRYIQKEEDDYEKQCLYATIFYHKVGNVWAITKSWIDHNDPNFIEHHHTELLRNVDFSRAPRWLVDPPLEVFVITVDNIKYGPDVDDPLWESWSEFSIPELWEQGNDPLSIITLEAENEIGDYFENQDTDDYEDWLDDNMNTNDQSDNLLLCSNHEKDD
tara:strand:+ start:413 stop:1135 length:723 start_codon:yes stop_codon:yes gene_type:complete